jgi:Tfp pilus assembly protein PilX
MANAGERGTALLMALVLTLLVAAIGAAVAVTSRTEMAIAGNFEASRELLYAAEGAMALAIRELDTIPDWSVVLTGATASSFTDGAAIGTRTLPDGTTIVLCCTAGTLTADVQSRAHAGRSWGADTPQWQIFAWGRVQDWLPPGRILGASYVVAWVADDPGDADGNPAADSNNRVELHVQALGVGGGRRVVQATLERPAGAGSPPPPGLRIVSWRDLRW